MIGAILVGLGGLLFAVIGGLSTLAASNVMQQIAGSLFLLGGCILIGIAFLIEAVNEVRRKLKFNFEEETTWSNYRKFQTDSRVTSASELQQK